MKFTCKNLGSVDFEETWQKMQDFTNNRTSETTDEFWIVEHPPVFTLGLAGKEEHILFKNHDIPIVRCDRGGQITYHGPGQIVIYTLVDIARLKISIRQFVEMLENGVIDYLKNNGINAYNDKDAPGVYIDRKKIASLGLKVRKGSTYHGLSFNFNMDETPFSYINVCGYSGLKIVQLKNLITNSPDFNTVANELVTTITAIIYSNILCN
jgi:lipoyl(octanoyl) transferase